jgi:hypothetical protein
MPSNANSTPSQYYDKDPYPHVEYGFVDPGADYPVTYDNGNEEVSEVQQIMVKAPPQVSVAIKRTEDNQEQTVQAAILVRDLDTDERGNPTLYFRQVERDKPLITRKKQSLVVLLHNPYAFRISFAVKVFKNALRFYTPREVVREATLAR